MKEKARHESCAALIFDFHLDAYSDSRFICIVDRNRLSKSAQTAGGGFAAEISRTILIS